MITIIKHLLLAVLCCTTHTLFAQVYLIGADENIVFLQTIDNNLNTLLLAHVREMQAEESIRVPDSVVVLLEINADGSLKSSTVLYTVLASHASKLTGVLASAKFSGKTGKITLAVVYPPLEEMAYPMSALTEVPETQVCNNYDSTNNTFRLACFRYINEQNLNNLEGPDNADKEVADGWVRGEIHIGTDGGVKQIIFDNASFNPFLNDIITNQASQIRFLNGGYVSKNQVSYIVPFMKSFNYLTSGQEEYYLKRAEELYQQKQYYPCAFYLIKASSLGYKLSETDLNLLAGAYLLAGDSSLAFQWWRTNYKDEELVDKKLVPKRIGDKFEISLEDYFMFEEVSKHAVMVPTVHFKPVYPGCEKSKNAEEQSKCLNSGIMMHVAKTFIFPEFARQHGIQGRIFINFVIEKDGRVGQVSVSKSAHHLLDLEGLRVICLLPKMEPALFYGEPVRLEYTVPINAKLQ